MYTHGQNRKEIPLGLVILLFIMFIVIRWKSARKAVDRIHAKPVDEVEQLRIEVSQLKMENERLKAISDTEARAAQIIAESERQANEIIDDA